MLIVNIAHCVQGKKKQTNKKQTPILYTNIFWLNNSETCVHCAGGLVLDQQCEQAFDDGPHCGWWFGSDRALLELRSGGHDGRLSLLPEWSVNSTLFLILHFSGAIS